VTEKIDKLLLTLLIILFSCFSCFFFAPSVKAEILFQDNFDDGDANDWIVARNMQWSNQSQPCYNSGFPTNWEVKDGRYGISINGPSCVTESMPTNNVWNLEWNDYIIETDITFEKGVDGNIAFRYSGAPNYNWYGYHFLIQLTPSNSSVVLQRVYNTNLYSNEAKYFLSHEETYHIKIVVNGEHIQLFVDDNLVLDYPDAGGRFPTGRIALQASVGAVPYSEVWFDNVVVRSIDEPEPSPTPSPSPSPSPTPAPENIPIVLLPGFGGSWNTTALVTGGDGGTWKKTPFIKVYDNIKQTFLNEGYVQNDDYFEFYYDWRKPVDLLADKLDDFLGSIVLLDKPPDSKINLVGHSMGGVVARAYVQKYGEESVNKLVTTGSPHEGVIPAWQAWSGGEVGDRWSWQWIGLQLYLQLHKGKYLSPVRAVQDLTPALENLTPIFDFAKDESGEIINVETMSSYNNYLDNLKTNLTNEIKQLMVTIAGHEYNQSKDTVEWFKLGDRNFLDRLLGKWPEGKPIETEYTDLGDLTVLEKSALVNESLNEIVDSSHVELVSSSEGIEAILESLGMSEVTVSSQVASLPRNPSLIFFLHSPANIQVTSPDGFQAGHGVVSQIPNSIYSPEDKMLIIYNALIGEYEVRMLGEDDGQYGLEVGYLTEEEEKWFQVTDKTTLDEVDSYRMRFGNAEFPNLPLVDETSLTQLRLALVKLESLKKFVNDQEISRRLKYSLARDLSQNIYLIKKAIKEAEKANWKRVNFWTKLTMSKTFSLRQKVGKIKNTQIENSFISYINNEINQAGELLFSGLLSGEIKNSRQVKKPVAQRYIKIVERFKSRVERKFRSVEDDYFLGEAVGLAEEYLNLAKTALDEDDYQEAYYAALVSRQIYLEALRMR